MGINTTFGERLKVFRDKHLNLSQSQFGKRIKITQEEISRIETGRAAKLTDRISNRLRSAFPELNQDWLVSGDGEMIVPKINRPKIDPSEFARAQGLGPSTCVAFKRLCGLSQSEKDAVEKFLTDERVRALAAIIAGK